MSDEPEVRVPPPRRPAIPETFTIQDVLKLLAEQGKEHTRQMMEFAKELKKPTEREQKEIDEKEGRIKQHQEARMKTARAQEASKAMQRRSCPHGTTHAGTGQTMHQWRAQVHTPSHCDPYFLPTCTQCQSPLDPIRATAEMLTQGVNLDLYKGLNMDTLLRWAPESWKGHEDRHPSRKAA